ncbi:hypothetical protein Tco_1173738 [Tanacetum coccineum]
MYQVVLDTLKISPCYKAFLVIADVPEIYIHQFWFTITKIKDSSSYKFKLDKKKFKVRVEVFREVLQDFLINSLLNHLLMKKLSLSSKNLVSISFDFQEFKSCGVYKGDHPTLHLQRQTISVRNYLLMHGIKNDIVMGMLKFVSKYEENQVYGKPISDVMLSKEVTETKTYKTYLAFANGNAIPKQARKRTIAHIKESSLKADDNIIPDDLDVALKLAKSISRTEAKEQEAARLVHETHEHLVTEQSTGRRRQTAMLAADTKKAIKASKRDFRSHHQTGGLSEKAGSKPEVPDESKGKTKDTNEGAGLKPEVLDVSKAMSSDQESENESWGDSEDDDDEDDHKSDNERTKTDDDESIDLNKIDDEEGTQEDEFVHTPDDYVPTDDETHDVDDEEYVHINEELYDDVNVEMKDVEPNDEGKGDKEMTDIEKLNAEYEEINQEVASAKVQDDVQATTTVESATQKEKTKAPPSSSSRSVSSNYVIIPEPTVLSSIPEITTEAPATTISPFIPPFIPIPPHLTPIPTPTSTEATISTHAVPESKTLFTIHLRVSNLENEVKELRNVDHSTSFLATIKSKVLTVVKEYIGTSLRDALHKVLQRHTTEFIKEHSVPEDVIKVLKHQQKPQKSAADIYKIKMEHAAKQQESQSTIKSSDKAALNELDQKHALFETMTTSKSFNNHPKHIALYHALIESILADEDAIHQGVAEKQKKRKPDDEDRDEDPPAGPNQGLKRRKTSKDVEPSKRSKSTGSFKGNTSSQPKLKSTGKSIHAEETVYEAEVTKTPQNQGDDMGKSVDDEPTQNWLSDLEKARKPPLTFNELISTPIDFSTFAMNRLHITNLTKADLVGPVYNLLKGTCKRDRCPVDLSKPLPLVESRGHQIVPAHYFFNNDLENLRGGSTDIKYTTSITKTKAAKYELKGIEDMVPTLWSPIKVAYDKYAALVRRADQQLYKFMKGDFPRLHLNDIEDMLLLVVQNKLFNLKGDVIVDLAMALQSYQKKLNISKLRTCDEDLSQRAPYTTLSDPQGFIYEDKLNRKRLMHSNKLHKFSDGTLQSVRDTLYDMANNLKMGYNKVTPRRKWSNLDKKWSHIMVKDID